VLVITLSLPVLLLLTLMLTLLPLLLQLLLLQVDSAEWNDCSDALVAVADGRLIVWYHPSAAYIDKDLLALSCTTRYVYMHTYTIIIFCALLTIRIGSCIRRTCCNSSSAYSGSNS
jgi:hypothetical protein